MRFAAVIFTLFALPSTVFGAEKQTQYFAGTVTITSLDGQTPFGPSYPTIARRIADVAAGVVDECVFQKGSVYVTQMIRTQQPLVFAASDLGRSFTGSLVFADASLSSWSYDLTLTADGAKVTGQLPVHGAKIDEAAGTMLIKKIVGGQVLVTEDYKATSKAEYDSAISNLSGVPASCR